MSPVQHTDAVGPPKPPPPPALHPQGLSQRGVELIARFEGFRSHPYNDATGNATIGYGHLMHYGPVTLSEQHDTLSNTQGLELLRKDAQKAVDAVKLGVHVHLTQPQFDALVSFAFNIGGAGFHSSQAVRDLNAGHHALVAGDLMHWVHGNHGETIPGLVTRRRAEGELFVHAIY